MGATLAMATVWLSESDAPSESLTVTVTVELAGPSGKLHTKLPAPVVGLKVSVPTWLPLAPQSVSSSGEGVGARIAGAEAVGVLVCPR